MKDIHRGNIPLSAELVDSLIKILLKILADQQLSVTEKQKVRTQLRYLKKKLQKTTHRTVVSGKMLMDILQLLINLTSTEGVAKKIVDLLFGAK